MPRSSHVQRVAAMAAVFLSTLAPVVAAQDTRTTAAAIDSIAAAALATGPAAGMTIVALRGRDTIVARGYGMADVEQGVAAAPATVYEIGSVTKQFTATAILQLVELGKLSLDDTLGQFFRGFRNPQRAIPIRRLLNHTSGLKNYTDLPQFAKLMRTDLPADSMIAIIRDQPADFAPGAQMSYNNSAYFLLGRIVEMVSGEAYADYIAKHVFAPAGMAHSSYCSWHDLIPARARGYDVEKGALVNTEFLSMSLPFSAGALCSTALDLAQWERTLRDRRVLRRESLTRMLTPEALADGTRLHYGYGVVVTDFGGHRKIHHGGDINGFASEAALYPDDSLVVIVLINTEGPARPDAIERAVAERILGVSLALHGTPLPAAQRSRYLGTYAASLGGEAQILTVRMDSATLRMSSSRGRTRTLVYLGNDSFTTVENQQVLIRFAGDGALASTLIMDGMYGVTEAARAATAVSGRERD